jgi:hypothetical protein
MIQIVAFILWAFLAPGTNNTGHRDRLDSISASYGECLDPSLGPETVNLACITAIFLSLSGLMSGSFREVHRSNIHPKTDCLEIPIFLSPSGQMPG